MTNSKNTKKALLASVLSMLICLTMLVGTTFAWFTDSVINTENRIEAGKLKIDLLMDKEGHGTYTSIANGNGDIFSEVAGNGILWEPGKTEIVYLGVQNKGTLALNYNIILNITDGDPGLVGSLEFAILDGKKAADLTGIGSWSELTNVEGAVTGDVAAGQTVAAPNGTLDEIAQTGEENETDYFALAVHMKEDAGIEYMNGSITIDIKIIAKQAMAEQDGFGNAGYDAGSGYPVKETVSDTDSLLGSLNNPGVPTEITVENSLLNVKNFNVTGDVTLNLGKSMLSSSSSVVGATLKVTDGGSLTINAEQNDYGFDYTAGGLSVDGDKSTLTVNGGRYGISGASGAEISAVNGATATINSGTFSSSGASGNAVRATEGSTITVNGGSFSVSGYESEMFFADGGKIVIEDCEIGTVNGKIYSVANGGQILVSKAFSSSQPTSLTSGCTVSDAGNYWLITEA